MAYSYKISDRILLEDENGIVDEKEYLFKYIQEIKNHKTEYYTMFNGVLGYTDSDLGMDKVIELISENDYLCNLETVYPIEKNNPSTSSVCFVDIETKQVYVIFVGNYYGDINTKGGNYDYTIYSEKNGEIVEEETIENIVTWVSNTFLEKYSAEIKERSEKLQAYIRM